MFIVRIGQPYLALDQKIYPRRKQKGPQHLTKPLQDAADLAHTLDERVVFAHLVVPSSDLVENGGCQKVGWLEVGVEKLSVGKEVDSKTFLTGPIKRRLDLGKYVIQKSHLPENQGFAGAPPILGIYPPAPSKKSGIY